MLKLADLMEAAEEDGLACMDFPRAHRAKIHSTNPIERLNGQIKQRIGVVPNGAAIVWPVSPAAVSQASSSKPTNGSPSASAA